MNMLFINGSPNKNGSTAALARKIANGKPYTTINLTEYRINCYGQELPGDQFDFVLNAIQNADTVIIGSPVYWHNLCGSIRNLLDRFYGPVVGGSMKGKKLLFVFQGAAPEKWMLEAGEYTMKRFAALYGFTYQGMATDEHQANTLAAKL